MLEKMAIHCVEQLHQPNREVLTSLAFDLSSEEVVIQISLLQSDRWKVRRALQEQKESEPIEEEESQIVEELEDLGEQKEDSELER